MSGYGAGIRRGVMAGDQFTQIANALFRDPRLSFKAKGIFGLVSTHRDGWTVTVAELVRQSREGRDAITRGLKELEEFGYLTRHRARREDGTLGESVYTITDMPAHFHTLGGDHPTHAVKTRRSPPESGNPAQVHPAQGYRHTKNTKGKNTKRQKTRAVLPAGPNAQAHARDSIHPQHAVAKQGSTSPGVELLLAVGAQQPELLLTGPALHDQGAVATTLLHQGWTPAQLQHVIADRPLPRPIRTSVAAIVAARLRAAESALPPDHAAARTGLAPTPPDAQRPFGLAADRPVPDALAYRPLVECAGCGAPGPAPGQDLCPACLNWPLCTACTGPTPRRAPPDNDGHCTSCAAQTVLAASLTDAGRPPASRGERQAR